MDPLHQGALGIGLDPAGVVHHIEDGQRLEGHKDHPAELHAGVQLHAGHVLGHGDVIGVGGAGGIADGHAQEDDGAAHDGVIPQAHENSHEHREQPVYLLINAHGGAQNAQHQHGDGDQQPHPVSDLFDHCTQCRVHGAVLSQHIDKAIGEDDQEHDVGRVHIAGLQGQKQVKDAGGVHINLVIGIRHDHHSARHGILHPVILAGGDNMGQDQHQDHDGNQDHIRMRHFKFEFLLLFFHSHLLISCSGPAHTPGRIPPGPPACSTPLRRAHLRRVLGIC